MDKRKFVIIIAGIAAAVLLSAVFFAERSAAPEKNSSTMEITSPAFKQNGSVPSAFTCDGSNVNPELRISGVPESARSIALIMDDPDTSHGTFTHWLLWNIAPNISTIGEKSAPSGATEGTSGTGKTGYIGPCPPSGEHRYFFKLYALDAILDLPAGASKAELEAEIQKHQLAKAELVGLYRRAQ